jgi:hypothetical protein
MGTIALACIVGNVLLIALLKLCQGWTNGRARHVGIIFSFAAAILISVGTITYDQKAHDALGDGIWNATKVYNHHIISSPINSYP